MSTKTVYTLIDDEYSVFVYTSIAQVWERVAQTYAGDLQIEGGVLRAPDGTPTLEPNQPITEANFRAALHRSRNVKLTGIESRERFAKIEKHQV